MVLGVYSGGALRLSASVELTAPAGGAIAEFVAAVSAVDGELLWGRALEPNAAGDAPAIVAAPHIIARGRRGVCHVGGRHPQLRLWRAVWTW